MFEKMAGAIFFRPKVPERREAEVGENENLVGLSVEYAFDLMAWTDWLDHERITDI